MKKFLVVLLTNISLTACLVACSSRAGSLPDAAPLTKAKELIASGIAGGQMATAEVVRSVVEVYDVSAGWTCSGVIIAPHVVLTAAHCIRTDRDDVRIYLGSDVTDENAPHLQIDQVVINQHYAPNLRRNRFDIALLYFSIALPTVTTAFAPLPLASMATLKQLRDDVTLAGYGVSQHGARDDGILRMVTVKGAKIDPTQVDFQIDIIDGKGACTRDSGGPMMIKQDGQFFVVAIDSTGLQLKNPLTGALEKDYCQFRNVFTNVIYFRSWISEKIIHFPNEGL